MSSEFSAEEVIGERKFIGSLPDDVPHELIEALADELDGDPELYFERKERADEIKPILRKILEEGE
jgi:hypothetical protein